MMRPALAIVDAVLYVAAFLGFCVTATKGMWDLAAIFGLMVLTNAVSNATDRIVDAINAQNRAVSRSVGHRVSR